MIEPVRTLTCFIWALALALPGLAAERIPGTQVTLAAPEHFMASADFAGYANEQTGASLMVTEIPGPYAEVMKGMTAEGMIACRDPLGIRPLVMGRIGDAYVFSSETVALLGSGLFCQVQKIKPPTKASVAKTVHVAFARGEER